MAADIVYLLDHLNITEAVHVVGHDIGGMIAYAFASRYPDRTASVNWGECPLPGTQVYNEDRMSHAVEQFHFFFHAVPDLPEALVAGREEIYLNHFFDKISHNRADISQEDRETYVKMYKQPDALRCAFEIYRAFPKDAEENKQWLDEHGKSHVRALGVSGAESRHRHAMEKMMREVHQENTLSVVKVEGSGHYIAEEASEEFARVVVQFVEGEL